MFASIPNLIKSTNSSKEQMLSQAKSMLETNPFYAGVLCKKVIASYPPIVEYSQLSIADINLLRQAYLYEVIVNVKLAYGAEELENTLRILIQLEQQLVNFIQVELNKPISTSLEAEIQYCEEKLYTQELDYDLIQHKQYLESLLNEGQIMEQLERDIAFLQNNSDALNNYMVELHIMLVQQELDLIKQKQALLEQELKSIDPKIEKFRSDQRTINQEQNDIHELQGRLLAEQEHVSQVRQALTQTQKLFVQKQQYLKNQQGHFRGQQQLIKELLEKLQQQLLKKNQATSLLAHTAIPEPKYLTPSSKNRYKWTDQTATISRSFDKKQDLWVDESTNINRLYKANKELENKNEASTTKEHISRQPR